MDKTIAQELIDKNKQIEKLKAEIKRLKPYSKKGYFSCSGCGEPTDGKSFANSSTHLLCWMCAEDE